jgi:hypothetical protein
LEALTKRWTPLKHHDVQQALWNSTARFIVNPAGRRSGKTELAKRRAFRKAATCQVEGGGRFLFGAPTREQAKRIYWKDLKRMCPDWMRKGPPNETELTITLITDTLIGVVGMDKPERVEGDPIDGIVLDEFANMKPHTWDAHVRPALSTPGRLGWAMLIGVPEGRNHYWQMRNKALERAKKPNSEWAVFTWKSADILQPEEVQSAREDMDTLTFQQEYEADFINFAGAVYYTFNRDVHCVPTHYDPRLPLVFCFDFNISPGIAVVLQEQARGTCVIGEVWIPKNSNTPAVCNKLKKDWGNHTGEIHLYGDATGGAGGTAKIMGSDWELIKRAFPNADVFVKRANPRERERVNAVNTRLLTGIGTKRLFISNAPHLVEDFEGTRLLEGGSGEIDKKATPLLTHMTDALGYYIEYNFPLGSSAPTPVQYG